MHLNYYISLSGCLRKLTNKSFQHATMEGPDIKREINDTSIESTTAHLGLADIKEELPRITLHMNFEQQENHIINTNLLEKSKFCYDIKSKSLVTEELMIKDEIEEDWNMSESTLARLSYGDITNESSGSNLITCVDQQEIIANSIVKTEIDDDIMCKPFLSEELIIKDEIQEDITNFDKIQFTQQTIKAEVVNCQICNESFSQIIYLANHMETHTEGRPFECEICHYRFTQKQHLKQHIMTTHTGEKPCECELCAKKFGCLIHTREKPYECKVCAKRFSWSSTLQRHMNIHSEEKPFECKICLRKFTQLGTLKSHMTTHTGEKLFACEICGYRSARQSSLKNHMITHIKGKNLKCKICERKFKHLNELKLHVITHNGHKIILKSSS